MRIAVPGALLMLLAVTTVAGDRGVATAPVLSASPAPNPGSAAFPRFTIVGWVSPPVNYTTPSRYAELAAAGCNATVLAWLDPGTEEFNRERLASSRGLTLRNLLLDLRLDRVHEADPEYFATLDSVVTA